MRITRTKNSLRNLLWGMLSKVIMILLPFIVRTILIYKLGNEYVGLSSLFTSILQVLSLAELGFGSAIVYSMYKPIAENDIEKINSLLLVFKKFYRIIGLIILGIGSILWPLLKYLIIGSYPSDVNIYVLYGIYLLNTVSGYFMFAYKGSLLTAYQREDIKSKINIVVYTVIYIVQSIVLICFRNYYLYIIVLPLGTISINIWSAILSNKLFPDCKAVGKIRKYEMDKLKIQVYSLIWHKLGNTIIFSFDNIIISMFLGLETLGIYNNYYYILNAISSIMTIFYTSITASVGNSILVESTEKNYSDFRMLTFLNWWIIGFCSICLLCLYQPFMKIWSGDDSLFNFSTVILFSTYFYIFGNRRMTLTYKDAAGMWNEDRYRPITEAIINLIINIILVKYIGINGVIISTIVSMLFIGFPWETHVFFKGYFKKGEFQYYRRSFWCLLQTIFVGFITFIVCNKILYEGFSGLIAKLGVCILLINGLFFIFNFGSKEFKYTLSKFQYMFKRK